MSADDKPVEQVQETAEIKEHKQITLRQIWQTEPMRLLHTEMLRVEGLRKGLQHALAGQHEMPELQLQLGGVLDAIYRTPLLHSSREGEKSVADSKDRIDSTPRQSVRENKGVDAVGSPTNIPALQAILKWRDNEDQTPSADNQSVPQDKVDTLELSTDALIWRAFLLLLSRRPWVLEHLPHSLSPGYENIFTEVYDGLCREESSRNQAIEERFFTPNKLLDEQLMEEAFLRKLLMQSWGKQTRKSLKFIAEFMGWRAVIEMDLMVINEQLRRCKELITLLSDYERPIQGVSRFRAVITTPRGMVLITLLIISIAVCITYIINHLDPSFIDVLPVSVMCIPIYCLARDLDRRMAAHAADHAPSEYLRQDIIDLLPEHRTRIAALFQNICTQFHTQFENIADHPEFRSLKVAATALDDPSRHNQDINKLLVDLSIIRECYLDGYRTKLVESLFQAMCYPDSYTTQPLTAAGNALIAALEKDYVVREMREALRGMGVQSVREVKGITVGGVFAAFFRNRPTPTPPDRQIMGYGNSAPVPVREEEVDEDILSVTDSPPDVKRRIVVTSGSGQGEQPAQAVGRRKESEEESPGPEEREECRPLITPGRRE